MCSSNQRSTLSWSTACTTWPRPWASPSPTCSRRTLPGRWTSGDRSAASGELRRSARAKTRPCRPGFSKVGQPAASYPRPPDTPGPVGGGAAPAGYARLIGPTSVRVRRRELGGHAGYRRAATVATTAPESGKSSRSERWGVWGARVSPLAGYWLSRRRGEWAGSADAACRSSRRRSRAKKQGPPAGV